MSLFIAFIYVILLQSVGTLLILWELDKILEKLKK
jgi:hypothetical protein